MSEDVDFKVPEMWVLDSDLVKELYEQDKLDTKATQEALDETLENNTKWSGRDALGVKYPHFQ